MTGILLEPVEVNMGDGAEIPRLPHNVGALSLSAKWWWCWGRLCPKIFTAPSALPISSKYHIFFFCGLSIRNFSRTPNLMINFSHGFRPRKFIQLYQESCLLLRFDKMCRNANYCTSTVD